ncbi:IclR family transcriptional regulator [Amycolatopsis thermalba]|uniref:IclR family transcriptional regulator n=1 Tax=Amycolatopsis thermalba TaxID=944492 RepID=A0ABY4P0H5_9PSEU|nr:MULTISPECIES: IclR family transcriptional regulator [Amycolatopsis]OXM63582.1 IclR family transcriptional regulator [Amycolatopsis sp. KNN50.9b]UQS25856.1 IclR family transcriptional regulator [Amycolatopsis thermalba]
MDGETPVARRGKRPKSGAPVVDRALSLLAAFDEEHRALGLADLSRRAGVPRSTAVRLAARLREWGALERDERGRYVIGLRLFEIASLAPRSHGLREVALPYLEDLHEVTRQHVLLAVRDGAEALLVERLSTRGAVEIAYRVGGRLPLHDTGVGIVLLSGAPPELLEERFAELSPAEGAKLRRRLADTRRLGVAIFDRRKPAPVSSVAAPIHDHTGTLVAAVSVVVPAGAARPQAYEQVVRATALAISRGMGLRRP